ncbi:MAG: response regulator [Candidatus Theseobacter exili]|nr:response regulator [Candidatus Theseobacter exili]
MIKIAVIDDDTLIRHSLEKFLKLREYDTYTASSGLEGINLVKEVIPHIVFLDIGLPDISGLDVLKQIRSFDKTIRVIIISAMTANNIIESAKKLGACDYIVKPFTMDYLENVVVRKVYIQSMEHQRRMIVQIIYALANALEAKDQYTRGHSDFVAKYTNWIFEELESKPGWEWLTGKKHFMETLALLHDIGKMGIEDRILNKPGALNENEMEEIQKHPSIGANIVSVVEELAQYAPGIMHHHEWWNGKGYPDGLSGEGIPPEARILAVADSYNAMTSNRPYRKALSQKIAIGELIKNKQIQFDQKVVDAFIKALKKREKPKTKKHAH